MLQHGNTSKTEHMTDIKTHILHMAFQRQKADWWLLEARKMKRNYRK